MYKILTVPNVFGVGIFGKVIKKDDLEKYQQFIKKQDLAYLQQDLVWTFVKNNWDYEIIISLDEKNNIRGSALVLVRKIPILRHSLLYCPRGPIIDKSADFYKTLNDLLIGIKRISEERKAFVLKADPPIVENEEINSILKKFNISVNNNNKNFSGIQPQNVCVLDIDKKTTEEIFSSFHSKTRYNIRLAERKGVRVRKGTIGDLEDFYKIMLETAKRDNFKTRSFLYFYNLLTETSLFEENVELFVAEYEGKIISGGIFVKYGNQMEYLYGANSNEYRNVMASYLLQWEMIKYAKEENLKVYNFGGISGEIKNENNPLYGIYRFKKGFNSKVVTYMGEWNVIFNPLVNWMYNLLFKIRKKLKK